MHSSYKIIIVNRHRDDSLGGSELQCDLIAKELTNRGHHVEYIAPGGGKKKYGKLYNVIPCELDDLSIINLIEDKKPNIIYWRFNKNFFFPVAKWSYDNKIPFIFAASHIRDLKPLIFKKRVGIRSLVNTYIKSLWHHLGFKYIDALTVNNQEFLGISSVKPQIYIPNAQPEGVTEFEWNRRYCAWVSNIKQVKRPEKFIQLAQNLDKIGVDFLMIGAIQERSYDWVKVPQTLPDNVYYLGKKTPEEVNGILKKSELHIHTCHPEGFPNVFIQAWKQGTPSVSLGFDPGNLLADKEIGFNAKDNMQDFEDYVRHLLEDDTLREKLGQNAYKFAKSTFNIVKSVDDLEKLMNDTILNSSS